MKKLRFVDNVKFEHLDMAESAKVRDMVGQGQGPGIFLKIAATHAGIITGNNTFYLPDRMRKGTASWTAQYNKPVLTHHNGNADPVGRVVRATYVDFSQTMGAKVFNSVCKDSVLLEDNLTSFINGRMSKKAELSFIRDILMKDQVLNDKNYQGLGYSEITAHITSPDAIQKVLDGRYLTGSVAASTDAAVCSVCQTDWVTDDRCEHTPGEMYDGMKAFLVAGDFEYEEYSFVNSPADVHSRWIELVSDGKSEKIYHTEKGMSVNNTQDGTMAVSGALVTDSTETVTTEATGAGVTAATSTTETTVAAPVEGSVTTTVETTIVAEVVDGNVAQTTIDTLKAENEKLKTQLDALREELKHAFESQRDTEDELVAVTDKLRSERATRIADFKLLDEAGKLVDGEKKLVRADLIQDLLKQDDKSLESQLASVDTTRFIDKLSSGLTNSNPTGTISNPSAIVDSASPSGNDAEAAENERKVRSTYNYLLNTHGRARAEEYLKDAQRRGFIK